MRALITGATGFIGSTLGTRLRGAGWEVAGLTTNNGHKVDVRDADAVKDSISETAPDVVYHLAGVSGPMLLTDDPASVIDINCVGTLNVIRSAVEANVPRVVFGASVSSYAGDADGEPIADSIYGMTKRFGEMLTAYFGAGSESTVCSVRIGSTYGAGRVTFNPVHEMVRSAKSQGLVKYNENQREPMIWVEDCAELLANLALTPALKPSYDAVTELLTHRELAEAIAAAFNGSTRAYSGERAWYPRGFRELRMSTDGLVKSPMRLSDAIAEIASVI